MRRLAIIGVIFALGFPALPITRVYDELADVPHLLGYEAMWWAAVVALVVYVRRAEQLPLASVGLRRPSGLELAAGLGAGVAITVVLGLLYAVVMPSLQSSEAGTISQLMATPLWWRLISVVRAAVGEELLFRGYALERLATLTGSSRLAGVVSWAAFALEHVGVWGWSHLLVAGVAGAALTLLYLWRRNLWVTIVAHLVVDAIAVLAG